MSDLSKLAKIASRRSFFLGSVLASVATRDHLADEALCSRLHCSPEALVRLRLCRAPDVDAPTFADDVRRIADYCAADFSTLLATIKDAAISAAVRDASLDNNDGWLMAARDRQDDDDT